MAGLHHPREKILKKVLNSLFLLNIRGNSTGCVKNIFLFILKTKSSQTRVRRNYRRAPIVQK